MPPTLRVVLNSANIKAKLKSGEMVDALMPYAKRIQSRANAGSGDEGHDIKTFVGHDRASLLIIPVSHEARRAEAESRNLTKALEAGRG